MVAIGEQAGAAGRTAAARTLPTRPWRGAVALLLLGVGVVASGWGPAGWVYLLMVVGAAAAAWRGSSRGGGERRALRLIALGVACSALGDVLESAQIWRSGVAPQVSIADVAWVCAYVALSAGLLQMLRASAARRSDIDGYIDLAAILVVVLLLEWELAVEATVADTELPLLVRVVWALYPALDAVIIALVARLVMTRRRLGTVTVLLAGGAACWFAADLSSYLLMGTADGYSSWLDAFWVMGSVLLAAATWQRAPIGPAPDDPEVDAVGFGRIAVALLPLLVPGTLVVVETLGGRPVTPLPGFLATVLLVVLAFARTARLLGAASAARALVRSQARYSAALAANSADAVLLLDASGRILHDAPAFAALVGVEERSLIGVEATLLTPPVDRAALDAVFGRVLAEPGRVFEAEAEVRPQGAQQIWLGLRLANLLDDPDVGGVVVNVHDITARKHAEQALTHQAFHDPLTGLPNRALLLDRLAHACRRSPRTGRQPAVVYLDLDGFKDVNDSLGHQEGDLLLCEVASRLLMAVRAGDTVARIGGDEFAVLIEQSHRPVDEAETIAERILQGLSAPVHLAAQEVTVSASLGIAAAGPDATATSLLRDADIAMYRAKSTGRARSVVFDQQMLAAAVERIELEKDLAVALARGQMRVVYQPVVELDTDRIVGMEALLRWDHPRLGPIPPDRFILIAEDTGAIMPLGGWVLHEACRTAARWQRDYPQDPPLAMAVNVSARQLASDELLHQVRSALSDSGLSPASLVLEITETALVADPAAAAVRLAELRRAGIRLAIDDFGTGYSSLSYLRQFPVDILKIDRSFIGTMSEQASTPAIVRGLLDLGRTLGLETLAEGVELHVQREQLREVGCHLAQGHLFARALDATDAELLLVRERDRSALGAAGELANG